MEGYKEHYPVFGSKILEILNLRIIKKDSNFLDCTFGAGGHYSLIRKNFPDINYFAFDQDADAIKNAEKFLSADSKLEIIHSNFQEYKKSSLSDKKFDFILMDFGVSSHHFDSPERGFSFRFDSPLDMRMNQQQKVSAEEIVNDYSEEELVRIFKNYGEERFSERIAAKIVEERSQERLTRTKQIENIVFHCYPKKMRFSKTHPATRVFQALRIEVNKELEVIENTVPKLLENLELNGQLAVISFHSLEDRIVKHIFKSQSKNEFKRLSKKPFVPDSQEISSNSRSRSAKLRVIERIS